MLLPRRRRFPIKTAVACGEKLSMGPCSWSIRKRVQLSQTNRTTGVGCTVKKTVYVGKLPESVMVADTPTEWGGKRWTMLRWPLPEDTLTRQIEFGHEMFHRIQPELHLDAPDSSNRHLDTAQGRLWLQLEWRALAAALAESGPAQVRAIRDALAFRAHRRQLFPNSATTESSLEIAEGIPEYTGYVAALPDSDS